jgi:hypothetical protein
MSKYQITLASLFWLCFLAVPCLAKEWHNIYPLQTTRAEVLNLIGSTPQSQPEKSEFFEVENNIVTIKWTKPDCYCEDSIIEGEKADLDALVYQITVEPKISLPLKSLEPTIVDNSKKQRIELKKAYKNWSDQDVDCLIGQDNSICSITNFRTGFGYSLLNFEVTALYYLPTEKQSKDWKEKHKLCSQK